MLVPPSKSDLLGCTSQRDRVLITEEDSRWYKPKQLLIRLGWVRGESSLLLPTPTLVQPTRHYGQRPRQNDNRGWPMSCLGRSDGKRTLTSLTMVVGAFWKLENGRRLKTRSKGPWLNITCAELLSLHLYPSLTSIVEEKSTRVLVTDACEGSGGSATKVEEGRAYMGPSERYVPVWTSVG